MGKSAKVEGLKYTFQDHFKYLSKWMMSVNLPKKVLGNVTQIIGKNLQLVSSGLTKANANRLRWILTVLSYFVIYHIIILFE